MCVSVEDGTTTTEPSPSTSSTTLELPTGSESTTSGAESSAGADTTSGSSGDGSSTGGDVLCCQASCGMCLDGRCATTVVGAPRDASETISVTTVADYVVWTTGNGKTVEVSSMQAGGIDMQLAAVPSNGFVTKIAGDDTHAYFLDYGGPSLKRVSVPDGVVETVATIPDGVGNYGGVAVGSDAVYFAMRGSGGVWRASKDLSDPGADQVASAGSPLDVVLDDTHLYWADTASETVQRLALDESGAESLPQVVLDAGSITALGVDADRVYVGSGGSVFAADKDGMNANVVALAGDQGTIWSLGVDDEHVYWTSNTQNAVRRVAKDGTGSVEDWAATNTPMGLAMGCDSVYWVSRSDVSALGKLK